VNDPTFGELLRAPFDDNAGPNGAHLSSGDSGGGVFIFNRNTNQWELAAIDLGVDRPDIAAMNWLLPSDEALNDTTGLFVQDDQGNWVTAPIRVPSMRLKLRLTLVFWNPL
jgi:hypothetical protein